MHRSLYRGLTALVVLFAAALATTAHPAAAELLVIDAPQDGQTRTITLSRAEFEALPQTTIVTDTPWTEPDTRFTGVLLRDLLEGLDLPVRDVAARALNDYEAVIPADDIRSVDVLVAATMNGEAMPIRDKGPLWIIYPLTDRPELDNPDTESKMVWQLHRLTLK